MILDFPGFATTYILYGLGIRTIFLRALFIDDPLLIVLTSNTSSILYQRTVLFGWILLGTSVTLGHTTPHLVLFFGSSDANLETILYGIPLMPVWVLVLVDCFYIYSNISTGDSRGITTTFHLTGVLINLQPSTSLIMKLIWFPCTCSWLLKFQEIFHISAALILFSPEILTIIGLFTFLLIKRWGAILNHGNNRRYSYLIFIWYFTLHFSCINFEKCPTSQATGSGYMC